MSSLTSVLDIAKNALLTSQQAINVTSHNISNANTPGYSRQRAVIEAKSPVNYGGLYFGTGVHVTNIERLVDSFQSSQLRGAGSDLARFESKNSMLSALEGIIDEPGGTGLSSQLDRFFNSFYDVANNPADYADRSVLLSNANTLTFRMQSIDASVRQKITDFNKNVTLQVTKVNSLARELADLNSKISTIEIAGISANDLKDKRDILLEEISQLVNISVREDESGQVDVFVGDSVALVTGVNTTELTTELNPDNPDIFNIVGKGQVLNSRITGGSIKGEFEGVAYYQQVQAKLDRLSATIVKEVNSLHAAGYGLDGSTNVNFFTPHQLYTSPKGTNAGGGEISGGTVTDLSLVTYDDYEVRFSGPASYNIVNLTTGAVTASGAYTSGAAIGFDGLSVTITDSPSAPAAGDTFVVSITKNAAKNLSVSITDANKVAASSTAAGLPGDNTNALALAAIKDAGSISGSSIMEYYNGIVTDIGVAANETTTNLKAQENVVQELKILKESVSGVSLEEEAVTLIKIQRAYEASAKVMSTADNMLETLINLF